MVEASQVTDLQEILVRARAGDVAAESVMFEHLHARVFALAKKRIWDEETARDLTQDTLSTAFDKYSSDDHY
jgi:DNA-directed RNA polymerase specialized sigma24 family protein